MQVLIGELVMIALDVSGCKHLGKCFAMQSILIVAITILKVPVHILHVMSHLKQPRTIYKLWNTIFY